MTFDKDLTTPILPTEEWRDISGYEGIYQVSSLGRIKSLERDVDKNHNNSIEHVKAKIRRQHTTKDGYLRVSLCKKGIHKWFFVHRLVIQAFVGERPEGKVVDHINAVRTDNRLVNLRYCTPKENMSNPITKQKLSEVMDVVNKKRSKVVFQYSIKNEFIKEWANTQEIVRELKLDQSDISKCCRGLKEKVGGYIWKYQQQ